MVSMIGMRWLPVVLAACGCLGAWPAGAAAQTSRPAPADGESRRSEDRDLAERLIRQATGQQPQGIMAEITDLMSRSADRLAREFDPGSETCTVQERIVARLDEAIAAARRNRTRAGAQPRPAGDKRQSAAGQPEESKQQAGSAVGDDPQPGTAKGKPAEADRAGPTGRLSDFRRGWGNLPARDREEVLQGIEEDVLERYRELIESYFRTLAEEEDQ